MASLSQAARVFGTAAVISLVAGSSGALAQNSDASFSSASRFMQKDGEALYRGICQGCHMPAGQGAVGAGAYPALAKNEKLEASGYPIYLVVNGSKAMPGFARQLSDDQIAAVINYIRTHFGNNYSDAVTAADVKSSRP